MEYPPPASNRELEITMKASITENPVLAITLVLLLLSGSALLAIVVAGCSPSGEVGHLGDLS